MQLAAVLSRKGDVLVSQLQSHLLANMSGYLGLFGSSVLGISINIIFKSDVYEGKSWWLSLCIAIVEAPLVVWLRHYCMK